MIPDAWPDAWVVAQHFAKTRWLNTVRDRGELESWQQARLATFISKVLPNAAYYRQAGSSCLADLPLMDKQTMLSNFSALNTRGISLQAASQIALQAEHTRDFSPTLGDITIGMSSGTSGNRGIFLVSKKERLRWAGIMLAHALPSAQLSQILSPWKPALRIAFFLRANSNLYTTLNSQRIDFAFYDLLEGVQAALPGLNRSQPDVLVAPPSMLRALAAETHAGRLHIAPKHVISVAEVLEETDVSALQQAFNTTPHQLYQATEGFIAYSCTQGSLHLNERFMHIEPEWLDHSQTRFQPIITDFTRDTQLIVRYRLNDVLRIAPQPCSCGRAEMTIAAIEGRTDDVLWLPSHHLHAVPIFPDSLRRIMLLIGSEVEEYEMIQTGMHWQIGLKLRKHATGIQERISSELGTLWQRLNVVPPILKFTIWQAAPIGGKRRRIRMTEAPQGLACTF